MESEWGEAPNYGQNVLCGSNSLAILYRPENDQAEKDKFAVTKR